MDLFLFVLVSFLQWTRLYIACQVKSLDFSNLSGDKTLDYVAHSEMSASKIILRKLMSVVTVENGFQILEI